MNEQCAAAGLPQPLYYYESSGFWVVFRKDLFNEEDLQAKGLNPRQIKAVLYVKEKGKITNKEYQEINKVSRQTATNDLNELTNTFKLLINNGYGAGSYFEMVNSQSFDGQFGQLMVNYHIIAPIESIKWAAINGQLGQ